MRLSLSVCSSVRVCVCVCMRSFECVEIDDAPVLNKWPPCLCWFLPGAADAWIMWCRVLRATLAQSSWDHLWMWPGICIEWRNGSPPRRIGGAGEECARPTPCRQNQVLSVWLGTAPSISPVHFPLPRIKSAQGNTSALTTCRQDKQLSMPQCCQDCLMWEGSSDNVFITTCNWFLPARGHWDIMWYCSLNCSTYSSSHISAQCRSSSNTHTTNNNNNQGAKLL